MVASYTKDITLDINANTAYTTVVAKQGDSARWLKIHLTKDNIPYSLDATHNFMFRMRKPDGKGVINPAIVSLGRTVTYIAITVNETNFNNREYFIYNNGTYQPVEIDSFFTEVSDPQEDKTIYYIKLDTNSYQRATNSDEGPFYSFSVGDVQYYYESDNINYENSTINVQLTEQILKVAGRGYADIVEYDENGDTLSSIAFILNVMASPDVAGNATSTDEFLELIRVINDADVIIADAEAWARGTRNNADIGTDNYAEDKSVTAQNFDSKKANLYLYEDNSYVRVDSSATYDASKIYYGLGAGEDNNAKYYAEEAAAVWSGLIGLTASAEDAIAADATAIWNDNHYDFHFKLPQGVQGIQGERGVDTVWVSSEVPPSYLPAAMITNASDFESARNYLYIYDTSDSSYKTVSSDAVYSANTTYYEEAQYNVWINPSAPSVSLLATADQITFFDEATYSSDTVGKAIQLLNSNIGTATAAANAASEAAHEAAEAAGQVGAINSRVVELESKVPLKLDTPSFPTDFTHGILYAETEINDNEEIISTSWKQQLSYKDDLDASSLPIINGITLIGGENISLENLRIAPAPPSNSEYYIKPSNGISTDDLSGDVNNLLTKANLSVQSVSKNNESPIEADENGNVNLGVILTENNIVNKNYLDNSWFTISQRGFKTYENASADSYICDRWKIVENESSRTVTIESGRLTINEADSIDSGKIFAIEQILSDDIWQTLSGKMVCASINYLLGDDYVTSSWSFACPAYQTTTVADWNKHKLNDQYGWGTQVFVKNNHLIYRIFWQGSWGTSNINFDDATIYITKVKLELGEFSTLDAEAAPIYSEELAKCQRYFQYYGGQTAANNNPNNRDIILGYGIARDSNTLDITFNGLGNMVATPKVELATNINLQARRGFISANTTNQPIDIVPSALSAYAIPTVALTAATFTNDVYYLENNGTYTVASEFDATTAGSKLYYRKTYRKGMGDNLYAMVDRYSGTTYAQYESYYIVLPRTVPAAEGETETVSYIQFSAEP